MSQRHHTTQGPARPRLSPRALGSLLLLLALLGACSRRVNTASSRTWQAFVTRYNVLYNAREAYQTTYQTALDGTTDDYTLRLPIDPVLARATTPGAAPRFSRTIEKATKAIEEHSISRKPARPAHWRQDPRAVRMQEKTEYNPALAEAWLLIARSQLYGGDLPAAHTTLTDILRRYATEPASTSAVSTPCVASSSMPRRSCSTPPVVREKSSAKRPYSTIPQRPNLHLPVEKTLPPSRTSPSSHARRKAPYNVLAFPSSSGRSSRLRAHARPQRRLLPVRSAQAPSLRLNSLPISAPLPSPPRAGRASIACSVWLVYAATPPIAPPSTSPSLRHSLPPTSAKLPASPSIRVSTRHRPCVAQLPKPTPA